MKFTIFLTLCITFSMLHSCLAIKKSYIVYLGSHSHRSQATDLRPVKDYHSEFLVSVLGSKDKADEAIIYSYEKHINGFAAILDEEDAAKIAEHPDVVSVFANKRLELHTTHSWDFLNLERNGVIHRSSLWKRAKFGEGIIIANLDTGVWPESKSFSDNGYGPVPSKWKGGCQNETIVPCNKKLIGAKYFNEGYKAAGFKLNSSMNSPRDHEGHGSHTLSTAGGNFVKGVNVNGNGNGTAKGGSPRARVAAYKVCWEGGCTDADIMQGFDHAIEDGPDVISVSLGVGGGIFVVAPPDYLADSQAIGAFHAVKKGIVVVCSAGNSGPMHGSVVNVAPWMITVGSSTIDREFQAIVELRGKTSGIQLKGLSVSKHLPGDHFYPVIDAAKARAKNATIKDARSCLPGSLNHKKVEGKIVVCLRDTNSAVEAARAGAAGLILCNDKDAGNDIVADVYPLPTSYITYADGLIVYAYLNSTDEPLGFIKFETVLNTKPAPAMALFSSRGPNSLTPEILKPDITAPGVDIIAAYSESESASPSGFPYLTDTGTSMACPHVSGVVGLLKTLHPDWSPAAIKSAIMTTAGTRANTKSPMMDMLDEVSYNKTNPFSYGAGHIRPNHAMDPGLVYDLSVNDYLDFLCAFGYNQSIIQKFAEGPYECPKSNNSILDFNYPSISVPKLSGTVRVTRKLKNVGTPGVYAVRVHEPVGISVVVEPKTLTFEKIGEEKLFSLTIKAKRASVSRDHLFGELLWYDGKHRVRSPIAVAVA